MDGGGGRKGWRGREGGREGGRGMEGEGGREGEGWRDGGGGRERERGREGRREEGRGREGGREEGRGREGGREKEGKDVHVSGVGCVLRPSGVVAYDVNRFSACSILHAHALPNMNTSDSQLMSYCYPHAVYVHTYV